MQKPNWPRVLVCGLFAGFVWTMLSIVLLMFQGGAFSGYLKGVGGNIGRPVNGVPVEFIANFVAGIWAIWLYAAIRPAFGPGMKTAIIAGVAWWVIVSQQSAKWVALLGVQLEFIWFLAGLTLPAIILATAVGAWLYERDGRAAVPGDFNAA